MSGTYFRLPVRPRIRSYLKALVLSCLVPVCLSSAYLVNRSYQNELTYLKENLQDKADTLSAALDRDLAIIQVALETLATAPALAVEDMSAFHAQAMEVLKNFPDSVIILADATGQQLVNTYKPFGEALPKRKSMDTVRRIFATGKPVISNVFKGTVTGRHLIEVDVPVFDKGEVRYDLAITLPTDRFSALFKHKYQQEWLITIADSDNIIAARSRLPEMYAGTPLYPSAPVLQLLDAGSHGTTNGINREGVPSTVAFRRSETTGWKVLVSVPRVIMTDALIKRLRWIVASLCLLFFLGFGGALAIARIITRSVQGLIEPALALGRGETVPPGKFALMETAEVAKALSLASNVLQQRSAEREHVQNTLKELNETLEKRVVERTAQFTAANETLLIQIAERRQAEIALRESEHNLREAQRIAHIGNWKWNIGAGEVHCSSEIFDIYGLKPTPSPLTPETLLRQVHPDDLEKVKEDISRASEGAAGGLEYRIVRPDGSIRVIYARGEVTERDDEGRPLVMLGINQDITHQVRVREELLKSKEQLSLALQVGNAGLWLWNTQTNQIQFDERFHEMLGYAPGELPDTVEKWLPYHHSDDVPNYISKSEAYLRGDTPFYESEHRIRSKAGNWTWVLTRGRIVHDSSMGSSQCIGIAINITDRKEAEEVLHRREEEFRALVENAPDVISLFDRDLRRLYVNSRVRDITGCEASVLIGRSLNEAGYLDVVVQPLEAALQNVFTTGLEETVEIDFEAPKGHAWFQIRCAPIRGKNSLVQRVMTIGRDMTDRKKNEIELYKLCQEKTALLKEIHHRVKNNLQIVVSLLGLQEGITENEQALAGLQDTQHRVRSMAILHELLYRSGNFASINLSQYLNELCSQILASFGGAAHRVKVEHKVAEVKVPPDLAIPCGLIVNELVLNAIKHAYPDGKTGFVTVELTASVEGKLLLTVADKGVGLPAGIEIGKVATLGLQLVADLTRQLVGHVKVDRPGEGGTIFRVTFPFPDDIKLEKLPGI